MTPTRQPNPALEWRLKAIDRMHPDLLVKFLEKFAELGIGMGPDKKDPNFNRNQIKDLTCTMAAFLKVLDEMGDKT